MQRWLIILFCSLLARSAAAQHAADSVFQQAMKDYGPRPGHTQTPEDIQRMKDALTARQQAYMRGDKDPVAQAATPSGDCTPISAISPAPAGVSGMDYAHNPMFKKCRVEVAFSAATGDTSSDATEQSHAGSGMTSNATMKLTMFLSDFMGRRVLSGGPDGMTVNSLSGKLLASGFDNDPNARTAYLRAGSATSNPLPGVSFTYNSDTSWSASVGVGYDIKCNSNPAIIVDRSIFSLDADQSNATLTHKNGSFIISKKTTAHKKQESGSRKQKTDEDGTLTMTISPDR